MASAERKAISMIPAGALLDCTNADIEHPRMERVCPKLKNMEHIKN